MSSGNKRQFCVEKDFPTSPQLGIKQHMSDTRPRFFLIILTAGLLLATMAPTPVIAHDAGGQPQFPTLTEKEEARLDKGKLVLRTERSEKSGSGRVTGVIEIQAGIEDVWKLLTKFELVPVASKAVKEATRYDDQTQGGATSGSVGIRYMVKVAWVEIVYYLHHDLFAEKHFLHWTVDTSYKNDIVKTDGSYSLWPGSKPGTVRFLYITEVDTGRNIPGWVEEELTESSLKRFLVFVKKRAES